MSLPKFRAKQIYTWLQVSGVMSYDEMTNLPKSLRDNLSEKYPIRGCEIEKKQVSELDGTVKYLFRLFDGEFIESVLMKYKYGYTLCVSSQVGCKMGCVFCASTKNGCVRSLYPGEILSQIHAAQRDIGIRVSHVVMMGMGEPLDNFENTLRFIDLAGADDGLNLSIRNISLSTCGVVPKIYELMERHYQLTLSVSLHAPNNELRSKIMPINKKYPIEELIKACKVYSETTSRRISFEYAMIKDSNDSDECANELANLLKGMLCHVNLIPANEIDESGHKRSTDSRLKRFCSILNKKGINVTVRRSLGSDIDASCGQLRNRHKKEIS
ncbi:MAG: 23S rRNA (adenine(2503)-C(2))-methyltransferase RlmN [Clostridia bacterium]|nr:23S rRNA (adenine(2503)-C(2))-methyltransferase RlmN [Clostridia bacterium]